MTGACMEVAISPDGTRILVGLEGAARLWTVPAQASSTELSRADTLVPILTMMEMDENGDPELAECSGLA